MSTAGRERFRAIVYGLVLLAVALGGWQALAGLGGKGKGDGLPGPASVSAKSAASMTAGYS